MKKNTMIFLSAILAIMILFIPNNKVLAWGDSEYININYKNERVTYYIENYSDFLEFMDEKLKEYVSQTGYKYIVYFGHNNNITTISDSLISYNVVFYDNTDILYMFDYNKANTSSNIQPFGSVTNSTYLYHTYFDYESFLAGEYDNVENLFEQNKITTWNAYPYFQLGFGTTLTSYNGEDIFDLNRAVFYFPYDTNANLVLKKDNDYFLNVSFDGGQTIHSDGDVFYTYKDIMEAEEIEINITKGLICDLEGNDVYNIRVDFQKGFNENNIFQIKTDYTDWIDVTADVLDAYNYGYYHYDYTLKYNSKLYARVLDTNNNILATNEIEVTDLNDFVNISHGAASDLSNRYINVITFDLINAYDENYTYQYSYDNEKFYDMAVDADNLKYLLNHAINIPIYFRILDANSNVVYEQYYNPNFEDLDKDVLVTETTEIVDDEKQINIFVDFSEYLNYFDMYNYTIYVDNVKYDEETFYLEFISTKDNFIKAIYIQIYVDNLLIEDIGYRCGSFGVGGGSDIDNFEDMYDNVLENELNNELLENNYDSVNNMIKSAQKFLESIADIVTTFFDLIMAFFNRLNIWIRVFIINLFVVFVVCKTIKAVRK